MIIGVPVPNNYLMPLVSVKCFLELNRKYPVIFAEGPFIYLNRNRLLMAAKKHNEHLLMIDSDLVFTMEDVEKMAQHIEYTNGVVTGLYPMGKEPYKPWLFKRVVGDYELLDKFDNNVSKVDACGGGFLGIPKEVIKQVPDNAFDHINENDIQHSEDVSFCHRLRERSIPLYYDPQIKLGHVRVDIKNVV